MKYIDRFRFALYAVRGYPLRSTLIVTAMAVGVAAVVVLSSLGEGARRYVIGQFASLGTNLLIVIPGRSETVGASPVTLLGETTRDLTVADAMALLRNPTVRRVAPIVVGSAPVSWNGRERDVPTLGTTHELLEVRHWEMEQGRFLPRGDPELATPVCVIGGKVRDELFGAQRAIGQWLRIGDRRFRVIGVMASEGRSIGVDVQELVMVPVASALQLFNTSSLFRIMVEAKSNKGILKTKEQIIASLRKRHQGEQDVTVITQDAVLATFDRILRALTLTVAGIAAISLAVAGILIMNVMLVAVTQRTAEIGLLKAVGAPGKHILSLFLLEAGILSFIGACLGLLLGESGSRLIGWLFPVLPMGAPWWAMAGAVSIAVFTGLLFGVLPAQHAARLDPVLCLARR